MVLGLSFRPVHSSVVGWKEGGQQEEVHQLRQPCRDLRHLFEGAPLRAVVQRRQGLHFGGGHGSFEEPQHSDQGSEEEYHWRRDLPLLGTDEDSGSVAGRLPGMFVRCFTLCIECTCVFCLHLCSVTVNLCSIVLNLCFVRVNTILVCTLVVCGPVSGSDGGG